MSPSEWDALEWWEKRLLLDGLQAENVIGKPDSQPSAAPVASDKRSGTVAAMTRRNAVVDLSKFSQQLAEMQRSVLDGL